MTNTHVQHSLSNVELLVLARLSCADGASEDDLEAAIAKVAPPDGPPSVRECVTSALAALRRHALVTTPRPSRRSPHPRSKPTSEGCRVLRTAFGLDKTPSWSKVRDRYVPALALGLPPASEQASKLGQTEQLILTTLRRHFDVSQGTTVIGLCDALLAKALGLPPGEVTLLRLRAHVLTRTLGINARVTSTKDLEALAAQVAVKTQGEAVDGKPSLRQVLGRRWAYRVTTPPAPHLVPRDTPTQSALPLQTPAAAGASTIAPAASASTPAPSPSKPNGHAVSGSPAKPSPQKPPAVSGDMLLSLVREAIPQIGSDGRFGPEKVFVSAIWHRIERDGRLPDLSLDRFKHWLVTFNRDQLLDLARADTLGEMDGRLVEESEIRDLGATFHFVVDRRVAAAGRGLHAR